MTDAMHSQTKIHTPQTQDREFASFSSLRTAPGPFVQAGDFLTLALTTSDATGSVRISGRLLTLEESIVPFTKTMAFSGTGSQTEIVCPLTDGWIIGFDVFRASGTITDGEVVAAVHVVQGSGTGANRVMCLASGEVTDIRALGLGAFLIGSAGSSTTEPTLTVTSVANPAAGADWVETVPAGQQWEVLGIAAQIVTSAVATSRQASYIFDDGATVLMRARHSTTFAASFTVTISGYTSASMTSSNLGTTTVQIMPTGTFRLGPACRIRSLTDNIQAADQWSNIRITSLVRSV